MDIKTKKIISIASIILLIITTVSLFYMVNTSRDLELKSGTHFCKIEISNEDNTKIFNWNIGISNNKTKTSIIENEFNNKLLEEFRSTLGKMIIKKYKIFYLLLFSIFVSIVFASVQKDSQLYKNKNNKLVFQIFFILLIIFLIYRIIISFVDLNGLYKDINYYFKLIS
ncbi:MAG: hypothetical protein N2B06_14285 [Clostridium sp.]